MDFKDKKIVIFGLGNYKDGSGISAALFFARRNAKLLVTDLKTRKELAPQLKRLKKYKNIKYVFDKHRIQDFKNADYIFKNPSVPQDSPYLRVARKNKIPIINDWTIFFEKRPENLLIGITGSKGKSTTTALIHHILKTAKKDVVLCGNIGQSPLSMLNKIKKHDCIQISRPHNLYTFGKFKTKPRIKSTGTIAVAELSSWLLHDFKQSPQIAIITNLMPEHQDKYRNVKEYYKDKENIFRFQNKNDYLILNRNDNNLKKLARRSLGENGAKSWVIWYDGEPKNAAIIVAKILKIPEKTVDKAIKNFKGLSGRLELICEKNGVKYYNDTTATMPDATIYALNSLKKHKKKIILIVGGVDKKLDYKNLTREILKYCKALILLPGTASIKIERALIPSSHNRMKLVYANSMKIAVKKAEKFATKGDIILLSPGAASFNMFKNEFDRGGQFNRFVKRIK